MRYLDSTETHLLFAASQQSSQLLRHLLAQGAKVNTYDENRTSPLHIACRQGNPEVVQLLLDHGAAVNITDCAGWSPLHVASYCQRSETVWMLLEHEADPTICNARGETPWDIASDAETQTVFKEFYRENEHPVAEVPELESSTQKQSIRDMRPSTDVDAYIPGPLNLSALESSAVHEALFPISKPANESAGDLLNVSYPATPISERSEDGVLEPYS